IATVTLNRPTQLNAFAKEMVELEMIFGLLSENGRVRVVVLTDAGAHLMQAPTLGLLHLRHCWHLRITMMSTGGRVSLSIYRCKKPVIAAINRHAVRIGITMTLPCTIRITHSSAKIAFPFVGRGLVPEAASAWFLSSLIGLLRASHILTTGETLPAGDKLLEGLFSEVLAKPEKTHLLDSRLLGELYNEPYNSDKQEGVDAFLQNRAPNFTASVEKDLPVNVPWWQEVDTK
ncbi:ClpP/crotonase-like domain-containing protein, partial [Trichophaea hybrida]